MKVGIEVDSWSPYGIYTLLSEMGTGPKCYPAMNQEDPKFTDCVCWKEIYKVMVIGWTFTRSPWPFEALRVSNRSLCFSKVIREERSGQGRDD